MKRLRGSERGYTAIEVLMAMTVFAIGAAGIIGMQRASIQGNYDARRLDIANSLAREWIERLRRDSMLWTTSTNIASTAFLGTYRDTNKWELPMPSTGGCPAATSGANADGLCPAFDPFGRDLAQDHFQDAAFCVNIRIDTVANDITATNPAVVRAMVRVYWPRGLTAAPFISGTNRFCSTAALSDLSAGPDAPTGAQIYHYVQAVTLISNNLIQQ